MSKQHETPQDESNQLAVMKIINNWMQNLPAIGGNGDGFHYRKIPTVVGESTPDYELWWNHLCVGVIEIKCRLKEYRSWKIDRPKLESLYNKYQKHGIPAMLAFAYKNGDDIEQVWFADMRTLIPAKDRWEVASPESMSTTNHGKDKRKKPFKGYDIPADLFWRLL